MHTWQGLGRPWTRRRFLTAPGWGAAGLSLALGLPWARAQAPSRAAANRIVLGCIGVGSMGMRNLGSFLRQADCQVVAVCDVDKRHAESARELVNRHYRNQDCRVYYDFRDLLARPDIEAISLSVPDHWHAIPAIQAARAGKAIYGETPLAHSLREGRAICDAVQAHAVVWQTGSWQRSEANFRTAVELVRNGRIGKLRQVEVGVPAGHTDLAGTAGRSAPARVPFELDYDFWLGPAPWAPYCQARVHRNWRWHLDYGGGQLMSWIGHHLDIAHWGMGADRTGPVEVAAQGELPATGLWNAPTRFRVTARYRDDVEVVIAGGYPEVRSGIRWRGDAGWVWVERGGLDADPKILLDERLGPDELQWPPTPGHHREFLDCVRNRRTPVAPAEVAHRSASLGHLGQIALTLGRPIRWNPDTEMILGDPTAARLLGGAFREPWRL